jgi:hypothetical protein
MRSALTCALSIALLAGLVLLGTVSTSAGVHRLVGDVPGSYPVDLRLRWCEERQFASGLNPQLQGHDDPMLSSVHESMRHIGGSYPPWSYTTGLLLVGLLGLTRWAPLRDDQWALLVVEIADTLIWVAAGWHIPFDRTAQRWTGEPWPVTRPATAR